MKLVLIIIGLIILYKIYNCNNIENFDTLPTTTILNDALSNLVDITTQLSTNGIVNAPGTMNVNGSTLTDGSLNVTGTFNLLPPGVVVSWWGSNIPLGWQLCDGNNKTPDLRDRFIFGKHPGSDPTNYPSGPITITLANNNIPPHNHFLYTNSNSQEDDRSLGGGDYTRSCPQVDGRVSSVYGNGKPSNNDTITIPFLPPYYKLAYIMKS